MLNKWQIFTVANNVEQTRKSVCQLYDFTKWKPLPIKVHYLCSPEINEMPMNTAPKNAHGQYPVWMNSRAVKRAKKAEKNKIIKRKRSVKSKSKPWR